MLTNMSDSELLRDCIWNSEDPVVKRLCEIILRYEDLTVELDNYDSIKGEWTVRGQTVTEYISSLEFENAEQCSTIGEMQEKLNALALRTVAQLIAELSGKLKDKEEELKRTKRELHYEIERKEIAEEKIAVWNTLEKT